MSPSRVDGRVQKGSDEQTVGGVMISASRAHGARRGLVEMMKKGEEQPDGGTYECAAGEGERGGNSPKCEQKGRERRSGRARARLAASMRGGFCLTRAAAG